MNDTVNVVHVVGSLHPSAGGPSRTVVQLTDALARSDEVNVTLVSQGLAGAPSVPSAVKAVNRHVFDTNLEIALKFGLPIRRALTSIVRQQPHNLLHSHGLWMPSNHWATRAARLQPIPLVIHPRGMLEPWALNHKALKKRLAMALFQRRDLEAAKVFFATAEMEYQGIRALGLRQPVAIIPNGVLLDGAAIGQPDAKPSEKVVHTALFLSRVHPIKGLLNLLQAWSVAAAPGWRLKIAGPDEGGHLNEIMTKARELGIASAVSYIGEVEGASKSAAYQGADLFVLPTFSENFGVVVAEALVHGVPVITTKGAPWADLETYGCGWWVDIGVEPLVLALRQAMALSDDQRHAMGERGRIYVQRYDWDEIASKTIDVYRWILGMAPKPDCVRTD